MTSSKKQTNGFTIIEVMIVLAIAGLIMLIVFLAVPTLQRTARNTQRKNDAAAALQSVNEYLSNNGGTLPASATFASPTFTVGAAATAQSTAKMGYYTSGVTLSTSYAAQAATPTDTLTIYEATKCANATTSASGTARQIAAVYAVEAPGTASGYAWQCQES